jgi:lipopolysaccharide export system permease protein
LNVQLKILDRYIIRKFLGTFFFSLALILAISVIFDISEKLDDFIEKHAPLSAIIFKYYVNFIPYFANLFAPLFVFISVIYFTARMAANTEIVAILNGGVSFRRMLRPYLVSAGVLALLSFYFNGWVIPHSNKIRLAFEASYVNNPVHFEDRNIHRQIAPGTFIYMESYNNMDNVGLRFSMEKIDPDSSGGKRTVYLNSNQITWDSTVGKWSIHNYYIRRIDPDNSGHETIEHGEKLDTTLNLHPSDFKRRSNFIEGMDTPDLNRFIAEEKMQGVANVNTYLVEKYKRSSIPFATFILTLIGVSLSSRKVRGGIGIQLGAGIGLSFSYILFMQVCNTFAINDVMPPLIAVWMPNILYSGIAALLLRNAPK